MFTAPISFRGSWDELFRHHLEPMLPQVADVRKFHDWLLAYSEEPTAVFPVRFVRGTERREIYSTDDGTLIAPADNSPAWVVHAMLFSQRLSSYADFKAMMAKMPAHMFDLPRHGLTTANSCGWYMAHIYPAKDRNIQFRSWTRDEVKRRCFRTLHPCNIFPVPGTKNAQCGEDARVIAFIAEQYAARYGALWTDFVHEIRENPLKSVGDFGSNPITIDCAPKKKRYFSPAIGPSAIESASSVAVSYHATRLTFKRDRIEPLAPDDRFEIVTPFGVYRFTKREFYAHFSNIVASASYREAGSYNGKNLHLQAQAFQVSA